MRGELMESLAKISEEAILLGNAIVSEEFAEQLVQDGCKLRVACLKSAEIKGGSVTGLWTIEVLYSGDGSEGTWLPITKTVGGRKPYKTSAAVVAVVKGFGFEGVCYPFYAGQCCLQRKSVNDFGEDT